MRSEHILGTLAQRWPIIPGQRHSNLFKVCAMANDLGIAQDEVRAFAMRYTAQDFPEREVTAIVGDAYAKVEQHGTKVWNSRSTPTSTPKWTPQETALIERMAQRMRETWATTSTPPVSTTAITTVVPSFTPSASETDPHIPLVDHIRASPHLQRVIGAPVRGRADHSDTFLLGLVRDHLFGATLPSQHASAEALACFTGCSWDIAEQALQHLVP